MRHESWISGEVQLFYKIVSRETKKIAKALYKFPETWYNEEKTRREIQYG